MKKKLAAIALSLCLLLSMAGCGGGSSAPAGSDSENGLTKVSMAFCTWTGYAPMFIAQEEGFFKDKGIDMEIQVIEDESTYASLITNGQIQFLATAQDPNIKMFANGANSRYVLTMDKSFGADALVAGANIKTLDDLKGKTVALDKSASSYYFFLKALEDGSTLKEEDINVQDMGDTTEAGVAFMGGQVDAAIMWEPELSEALDEVEGAHTVVTSKDYPDTISDSLVVNTAFAEENPDIVEAVAECWYEAIDFMKENPEKANELMASGFEEVTAEDIANDINGLEFIGREENTALNDESNEENIFAICQEMAAFWMSKGECETDDLTDYFALIKK